MKQRTFGIIAIAVMLLVLQFTQVYTANAQEAVNTQEELLEELLEKQVQSNEIQKLKEYIGEYASGDAGKIIDIYSPDKMISDLVKGNFKFNVRDFIKKTVAYFMQEVYLNLDILLKIAVLAILCALLKNLQASFMNENVGELAFFICYLVIVSFLVIGFKEASRAGMDVIEEMVGFMYATIPVMIALLVSGGNVVSGGVFHPTLIMAVEVSANIIKNLFLPLIFLSTGISVVNNLSDKLQLSRLSELIKKIATILIGAILTVFLGIITVQGAVGSVADGVASKTIKFTIGTFIPVVGSYLSDAADMVIACSLLVKNAAGVIAMICLIAICLIPILKIGAIVLMYKVTCALIQPVSEKRITDCINDIANSMILIISSVAVVAFMFIISVSVLIAAGNVSAMVR